MSMNFSFHHQKVSYCLVSVIMIQLLLVILVSTATTNAQYINYGGYKTSYATKEMVHQQQYNVMTGVQPAAVDIPDINEYPWLGLARFTLFNNDDTILRTFDCIGSLIYEDIFISSAHCVNDGITRDDPLQRWRGRFYLGSNNSTNRITGYNLANNYDYPHLDMAFIKIANSSTVPLALWNTKLDNPSPSDTNTVITTTSINTTIIPGTNETNATTVVSSSFGKVDVQSISKDECRDQSDYRIRIATTCTNLPSNNDDKSILCNGPLGGPLVTADGMLLGIASFISDESTSSSCISTTTQQAIGFTETSKLQIFRDRVICDASSNPPKGCVGFCGLFSTGYFCPLRFGGAFIEILRRLLNGSLF